MTNEFSRGSFDAIICADLVTGAVDEQQLLQRRVVPDFIRLR
jgi:hypothetical protein